MNVSQNRCFLEEKMPPTIQKDEAAASSSSSSSEKKLTKPQQPERKSDLICKVKYNNTLPDIPFDLKFIAYPFEANRFVAYNSTSLERNYRYEILTEPDLGVNIDLINRDIYAVDPTAQLHPDDEKLLEEDTLAPQDSKRSRHHARNVSWLRRTEYISTEQTRFQPQTMDKVEAKVGYSIKKTLKNETLYMDRESQIKAIEKTFEDAKVPIEKHYSKPNVVPVEILPVFPDFKVWKYPCAQVIFDSDPASVGKQVPAQIEEMSQAMIRGVMDESGEQFVAYFLPTDETLEKRRQDVAKGVDYQEDEEYEYKMAREYNWNVKSKASKGYEENYFLIVRPDGVYYNELETRVRLSKRRQKAGHNPSNTHLIVKHRPMDSNEYRTQRFRERQLEAPNEEEDDMEVETENNLQSQNDGENTENEDENDKKKTKTKDDESNDEERSSGNESRSSSRSSNKSEAASGSSKSRSRSPSKSKSRSRSRSQSKSRSVSKSRSRSKSSSKSRSRSNSSSKSRSRSKSRSKSRSQSKSSGSASSDSGSES